jgi:hypothetical protein
MVWIKEKQIETIEKQGEDIELDEAEAQKTQREKMIDESTTLFMNSKTREVKYTGEINSRGKGYWVDVK